MISLVGLKNRNRIFCIALILYMPFLSKGQDKGKQIPDIPGYLTLKCDLHTHTIFSDAKVWPTVRVKEAVREGLDVIALTDHIGKDKTNMNVIKDLDLSHEIALKEAKKTGLILIKGGELTYSTPLGHYNVLFLDQIQKLDGGNYKKDFAEAKKQDAFLIWNHSNEISGSHKEYKEDGIAHWREVQQELFDKDMIMGMEIVNGDKYNAEAHYWCLEKNLCMFGASDIHIPISSSSKFNVAQSHRPMTLVFSKYRSVAGIREALDNRRTAVWFENMLIGKEEFLAPIFHESISVEKVSYYENLAKVILKNNSSVDYILENIGDYSLQNRTRIMLVKAGEKIELRVKTAKILESFTLNFKVLNLLVAPDEYLQTELNCNTKK